MAAIANSLIVVIGISMEICINEASHSFWYGLVAR